MRTKSLFIVAALFCTGPALADPLGALNLAGGLTGAVSGAGLSGAVSGSGSASVQPAVPVGIGSLSAVGSVSSALQMGLPISADAIASVAMQLAGQAPLSVVSATTLSSAIALPAQAAVSMDAQASADTQSATPAMSLTEELTQTAQAEMAGTAVAQASAAATGAAEVAVPSVPTSVSAGAQSSAQVDGSGVSVSGQHASSLTAGAGI